MKTDLVFLNEMSAFLHTVTIYNPYVRNHYKQKFETLKNREITDKENPYIQHLMGNYFYDSELSIIDKAIEVELLDNISNYETVVLAEEDLVDFIPTADTIYDLKDVIDLISLDIFFYQINSVGAICYNSNSNKFILSKNSLNVFVNSADTYKYNNAEFINITNLYPLQSDFIKNILFPVDILDIDIYVTVTEENKLSFITPPTVISTSNIDTILKDNDIVSIDGTIQLTESIINLLIGMDILIISAEQEYTNGVNNKALIFSKKISDGPIDNLINIKDFSLVQYSKERHLESSELNSIVESITNFLNLYKNRWNVPEYMEFEKFAPAIFSSIMWCVLRILLLKQRICNIRTTAVHTDFIWKYLESNGLEDYRDILNKDQQLFLYKNYRYLTNIKGTTEAIKILADKILTPFNLSLHTKYIALDKQGVSLTKEQKETQLPYLPDPVIISKNIMDDNISHTPSEYKQETYKDIYDKEVTEGIEQVIGPDLLDEQIKKSCRMPITLIPTKLMELRSSGNNDEFGLEFIQFCIESFLYLLHEGEINESSSINIFEESVNDTATLSINNALLLLIYCLRNENAQEVIISNTNKNEYINYTIIYNRERIILTEDNIDSYVGKQVVLQSIDNIPNKFLLTRALKINNIISSEDKQLFIPPNKLLKYAIDNNILLDDIQSIKTFNIDDVVGSEYVTSRLNTSVDVSTSEKLLAYFENTYLLRTEDLYNLRSINSNVFNSCVKKICDKVYIRDTISLVLEDNVQITTYNQWFDNNSVIENIIKYNRIFESNKQTTSIKNSYIDIANELINRLLPIFNSSFISFSKLTDDKYRLIRKLFVQLTSYDIQYFSSQEKIKQYFELEHYVLEDMYIYSSIIDSIISDNTAISPYKQIVRVDNGVEDVDTSELQFFSPINRKDPIIPGLDINRIYGANSKLDVV